MPEPADYTEASRLLARTADEVRGINRPVEGALGPEVVSGGVLGPAVEQFVADAGTVAGSVADQLDELAAEASRLAAEAQADADAAALASASVA